MAHKAETEEKSERPEAVPLRILFVTQNLPVPVRGGSSQRTYLLVEALRKLGQVDIAILGRPEMKGTLEKNGYTVKGVIDPQDIFVLKLASRLGTGFANKAMTALNLAFPKAVRYKANKNHARKLASLYASGNYDLAVGRYFGPSVRAGVHLLPHAIIDIDDLESQKLASWLASSQFPKLGRFAFSGLIRRMRNQEGRLAKMATRVWVTAEEDSAELNFRHTDVVPNVPFIETPALKPSSDGKTVLFVGSFDYRINLNAILSFVHNIWPIVRADLPGLKLRIVGGGLGDSTRRLLEDAPGVNVAGFVSDLVEEYEKCFCSIVPIWEGGGTKIKIIESLSLGRTCVVAAPSARGYSGLLQHGRSILVADTAREFADSIVSLARDQELRNQLEQEGLRLAKSNFSHSALAQKVKASVNSAVSRHSVEAGLVEL